MKDDERDVTFGKLFPRLAAIGAVRLNSTVLRSVTCTPQLLLTLEHATRNGARTLGDLASMTALDVHDWPGYGLGKLAQHVELLRYIDSQSHHIAELDESWNGVVHPTLPRHFHSLAIPEVAVQWASTVHNALSTEEVMTALAMTGLPPDIEEAWAGYLTTEVKPHPAPTLTALLQEVGVQDPRAVQILEQRVLSDEPMTLDALGLAFGVTRERVRQLEAQFLAELQGYYLGHNEFRELRWLGVHLRQSLGAAAPRDTLSEALPACDDSTRRFLLLCEGYAARGDLFVHRDAQLPKLYEVPFVDLADVVVDIGELAPELTEAGVLDEHMDAVLGAIPGLSWFADTLVRTPRSVADRAYIVLHAFGKPMDLVDLHTAACPERSLPGFRERVYNDPRIMRVGKREVALRDWGLPEYGGVIDAMVRACETDDWLLDDLALELSVRFGVSEHSVRLSASAPCFRVVEGHLELRPDDDPYVPRNKPQAVPNLYLGSGGQLVWNIPVDRELLRGSGRALPSEMAAELGIRPGGERVLETRGRQHKLAVAWPLTSHTGPFIGSLKRPAENLGVREGDWLQISWDLMDSSVVLTPLPVIPGESPSDLLRRWCAQPDVADPELPRAIERSLFGGPVFDVLRSRGEEIVASELHDLLSTFT